ncbi:sigma-70 family RNA polymerase sigma factor [Fusicatenibacter saccharivorans]|uniref:RNA polymerase sigma factor n=1 Tax=Fusicatenibacter saccharivorans TaxID=1150298 RepID=UPI002ED68E1B
MTDEQGRRTMDKNNFSEIYKKYVMTAYSAAMQVVHNEADADDIAQETMVKLYLNIDALDEDLRAEEMELPTLAEEEKQERNHFFREVMDALKDHDESGYYITREIKVHERSEKEVASEMGITIGNLRVKMTRTKKWLCQHFADKARERGFL